MVQQLNHSVKTLRTSAGFAANRTRSGDDRSPLERREPAVAGLDGLGDLSAAAVSPSIWLCALIRVTPPSFQMAPSTGATLMRGRAMQDTQGSAKYDCLPLLLRCKVDAMPPCTATVQTVAAGSG